MGRPKSKKFRLAADQIVRMVPNLGACFATDRITVDGCPVGYMYREDPDDDVDSGWRFVAGDESESYMDDPSNSEVYDVNTIANYDPEILEFLSYPVRTTIVRRAGRLKVEDGPSEPPPVRFMTPVPEGSFQFADDLVLTAPCHLLRRLDRGSLVIWRPGLTMRCERFGGSSSPPSEQRETILAAASTERFEVRCDEIGAHLRLSYRLDEPNERGIQPALSTAFCSSTPDASTSRSTSTTPRPRLARVLCGRASRSCRGARHSIEAPASGSSRHCAAYARHRVASKLGDVPLSHQIAAGHLPAFVERTEHDGAGLPAFVTAELDGLLRCGDFEHGFLRLCCTRCGDELRVPFSCKGRGVCPSCIGRRMCETAANWLDHLLPRVPYRQCSLKRRGRRPGSGSGGRATPTTPHAASAGTVRHGPVVRASSERGPPRSGRRPTLPR